MELAERKRRHGKVVSIDFDSGDYAVGEPARAADPCHRDSR